MERSKVYGKIAMGISGLSVAGTNSLCSVLVLFLFCSCGCSVEQSLRVLVAVAVLAPDPGTDVLLR